MDQTKKETFEAFRKNKRIPDKYAGVILEALSYYPELIDVKIEFKLGNSGVIPYGTKPSPLSMFREPQKRKYIISLLEEASGPMEMALFKNLSYTARLGVIGHELNHVIQFNKRPKGKLIRFCLAFTIPFFKKRIERGADIATIEHGLGRELYVHATYIRSIPGYVEQRKSINKYYLKPKEILARLKEKRVLNTE